MEKALKERECARTFPSLLQDQVRRFVVPGCPRCVDGILKPWIVFFGDSVPQRRVETVRRLVQESSALLVIGSSLQVLRSTLPSSEIVLTCPFPGIFGLPHRSAGQRGGREAPGHPEHRPHPRRPYGRRRGEREGGRGPRQDEGLIESLITCTSSPRGFQRRNIQADT